MGKYTIVDDKKVESKDLGNNFFVTKSHLNQPKAQVTCELLQELNPDVQGSFLVEVGIFHHFSDWPVEQTLIHFIFFYYFYLYWICGIECGKIIE